VAVANGAGSVQSAAATLSVTPAVVQIAPRLASSPGPEVEAALPGSALNFVVRTGNLSVFSDTSSTGSAVVEAAGAWYPQGSLMQVDVDAAAGVIRNTRERLRMYFKSGRLTRLDLATPGAPSPVRVSTLSVSGICLTTGSPIGDVFDDWTQPGDSVLVYQTKPQCDNFIQTIGDRRYVAVRAGMSAIDTPIELGAYRPLQALRDRSGAITGFVVYDGTTLARVDANFANPTTIATNAAVWDDTIAVLGVYGTDTAPYLLYTYKPFAQPVQVRYYALTGGGNSSTTLFSSSQLFGMAANSTGVYILAHIADATETQLQLLWLQHDQRLQTLATRLASGHGGGGGITLKLSPSRCLVADGDTLTSIPLGAGSREVVTYSGYAIDKLHVVDEDVYVQVRADTSGTYMDATVKLMATDLTRLQEMPSTMLLAGLMPSSQPLVRRHSTQVDVAGVVLATSTGTFLLSQSTLATYTTNRAHTTLGLVPTTGSFSPQAVPNLHGVTDTGLQGHFFGAYHLGQAGVVTGQGGDAAYVPANGAAPVQLTHYP
jgi:hypothetical protein